MKQPFIIAGPCTIENEDMAHELARALKEICHKHGFHYIFKASYDKANRTSLSSFRGPGMEKGLTILKDIATAYDVPVTTDVHESHQVEAVASAVDIIQIPAFLSRQTDLLLAAAETKKTINIKKAQFMSAQDMGNVIEKVERTGNKSLLLTERGTMFGYNRLIVDYTGVLEMKAYGYPVVMDATHAVQCPGGQGGKSGGNRDYAPYMAYAAAAMGVKGFFFEVHQDPEKALSDGPNMIYLDKFEEVVKHLKKLVDLHD